MNQESEKYLHAVHRLCQHTLLKQNAWGDKKQDEFYNRYVTDLILTSFSYARALDEYSAVLEDTRRKIADLVGEKPSDFVPVFVGDQHVNGGYSGTRDQSYIYMNINDLKSR